ncbi:MAG TPA: MFS transporter, partial [Alphaproteobacteria bacterium]|nr:MFS transporter [Alphaproteobacteria bacterium]
LSGAVSLGGVLAALASPFIGPYLDRKGARAVLCLAVLVTGAATMLLSLAGSLLTFYLLFCLARMNFAGPYDLGIYGALYNWFVRRRAIATSIATLAQMAGLVVMPLIAHFAILASGWRGGWLAIGATVLLVGFLPNWLLMVRRPEDVGLSPDGVSPAGPPGTRGAQPRSAAEPAFTRRQALATPAFWLLAAFTLLVYPVQAGISLHQAPHLIERGLDPTVAATVVSTFSLASAVVSFGLGFWPVRLPLRYALALTGAALGVAALTMLGIDSAAEGYLSAVLFGLGIGGLLTMLPLAWANYFGRASFGAIRGMALTVQVLAQASGPLLSGILRDLTGDYRLSLACFAVLGFAGALIAFFARPPAPPAVNS